MDEKMKKGILPGIIAGYIFLAFVGAGMTNPVATTEATTVVEMVADEETGALSATAETTAETTVDMGMGNGMLDMVGGMIQADAFIGFILHIIISAVIGAIYTWQFVERVDLGDKLVNIVVGGLIYGLIWWIIGGNIIMPAIMNDPANPALQFSIDHSFFGHIIFGHALAFIVLYGNGGDDDE